MEAMGEGSREGFWMADEEIWGVRGEKEDEERGKEMEDVRRAMSVFGYRVDGREINADEDDDAVGAEAEDVAAVQNEAEDAHVAPKSFPADGAPPMEENGVSTPISSGQERPVVEDHSSSHLASSSSSSSGTVHSTATTPTASQGTCVGSVMADESGEKEKVGGNSAETADDVEGMGEKLAGVDVDVVDVVQEVLPVLVDAVLEEVAVAQAATDVGETGSGGVAEVVTGSIDVAPAPVTCPS